MNLLKTNIQKLIKRYRIEVRFYNKLATEHPENKNEYLKNAEFFAKQVRLLKRELV